MGCQVFTKFGKDGIGLYTSQASYCAMHLCRLAFDEADLAKLKEDEWYMGNVSPGAVKRADVYFPVFYHEQDDHLRSTYKIEDFEDARRFISKCAMAGLGFHCSY